MLLKNKLLLISILLKYILIFLIAYLILKAT